MSSQAVKFRTGMRVERFLIDHPDVEPQPGVVMGVSRTTGDIYIVGESYGMWWSPNDTTIGVRLVP